MNLTRHITFLFLSMTVFNLATVATADDRELLCKLWSVSDNSEQIQEFKLVREDDGTVIIIETFDRSSNLVLPKDVQVTDYYHSNNPISDDRFSLALTDSVSGEYDYIPKVWLIDWRLATVTQAYAPFDSSELEVFKRFECERID